MEDADPLDLFARWYDEASRADIVKPHAMALATTGEDGRPAARMVLLSSFDRRGFVFHTNRRSRKGGDLARMPWAALLFWWDAIGYQVRVEGAVAETSDAESDDYFRRRPRGSQLSAWASEQGMVVGCRADLEARMAHFAARYQGRDVPRPPHWGGYRVTPQVMEFWRRRDDRLHERARYRRNGAYWLSEVLAP